MNKTIEEIDKELRAKVFLRPMSLDDSESIWSEAQALLQERDRIAKEEVSAEYEERLQPVVERLKTFVDEYTKT